MAHQKKKNIKTIIAYLLVAAITIVITTTIYYNNYTTTIVPYDYRTSNYIGINADTNMLHFGTGTPGSILQRAITITTNEAVYITITTDHNYVYPTENNFLMKINTTKEITFYVTIPQQPPGNYSGKIIIRQKKVNT